MISDTLASSSPLSHGVCNVLAAVHLQFSFTQPSLGLPTLFQCTPGVSSLSFIVGIRMGIDIPGLARFDTRVTSITVSNEVDANKARHHLIRQGCKHVEMHECAHQWVYSHSFTHGTVSYRRISARLYANPPKHEIMRIVSAALARVSESHGGKPPRRRDAGSAGGAAGGACRESFKTPRVSVVVLRTFVEQLHSRV